MLSLKVILANAVKGFFVISNNIVIKTSRNKLTCVLFFLQKHSLSRYRQLIEIAAEDTPKHKNRFRINYILSSFMYNNKIIVTTTTDEITYLPSVTNIFSSAC